LLSEELCSLSSILAGLAGSMSELKVKRSSLSRSRWKVWQYMSDHDNLEIRNVSVGTAGNCDFLQAFAKKGLAIGVEI